MTSTLNKIRSQVQLRKAVAFAFACIAMNSAALAEEPYPAFNDLKEPVLFPENAKLTVSPSGNFLFNGKPRLLLGTEFSEVMVGDSVGKLEGYPPENAWIYEELLNYRNAQRIGFDTIGFFTVDDWSYQGMKPDTWASRKDLEKILSGCKLPLYVDFTCFPWTHGKLTKPQYKLPPQALNAGGSESEGNHWVPYNVNSPEGRSIYQTYWASGAGIVKSAGANALFYELFNEPGYNDKNDYNRALFAKRLQAAYGSIEKLNAAWHSSYKDFESVAQFKTQTESPALAVEWGKFMEDSFADICKLGVETIRKVDPAARCCVQPLGGGSSLYLYRYNVNIYKVNQVCDSISLPTGGGIGNSRGIDKPAARAIDTPTLQSVPFGLLERRLFLSIAKGKSLHDGELYSGVSKESMSSALWLEAMRGVDATYFFTWNSRSWDWKPKNAEGARKNFETFPWMMLNPYGIDSNAFKAIMQFKREYLKIADVFQPRENQVKPQIAVLASFPTVRYAIASGSSSHKLIEGYSGALDFSHFPYDAVLEEQLGTDALAGHKILFAPGVSNIYPDTAPRIASYVKNGGTLVLAVSTMDADELGNPIDAWSKELDLKTAKAASADVAALEPAFKQASDLPGQIKSKLEVDASQAGKAWKTVASSGGKPAILCRSMGKGRIYFIAARLPQYSLASVLGGILALEGVSKPCELSDSKTGELVPNIELHLSKAGAVSGVLLYNWDSYPKLAVVKLAEPAAAAIDPFKMEALPSVNGGFLTLLPPHERVAVMLGSAADLESAYGKAVALPVAELESRLKATPLLAKPKTSAAEEPFNFAPNLSKLKSIDLRPFANRGFIDKVPGDGKGGWTDQGADNSLNGVPWGMNSLCGVPFDLIRFDMNGDKTCIVMASKHALNTPEKVENIQVGEKLKAIYFLQAAAWVGGKTESMRYVVNYSDGSKDVIPVRNNIEIADWWLMNAPKDKDLAAKRAWRNTEGRGLYAFKWACPNPEKAVESISIESANGETIPIVVAITVETI